MDSSSTRLRPQAGTSTSVSIEASAHSLGVHDALRFGGPRTLAGEAEATHPLQRSLEQYEAAQFELKAGLQRNLYGLHAPLRLSMERELVAGTPTFSGLRPAGNLHLDILAGKDESVGPEDVLGLQQGPARVVGADFHAEMERRRGV